MVVNDWCAFTGLETTATEIGVIEATFSEYHPPTLVSFINCLSSLELQEQNSTAVIGEMRDSLIDNWA